MKQLVNKTEYDSTFNLFKKNVYSYILGCSGLLGFVHIFSFPSSSVHFFLALADLCANKDEFGTCNLVPAIFLCIALF